MRAVILVTLWLAACVDKPVDSDPTETDTGDCADGYDVETFIAEHWSSFCGFASTCPDFGSSEDQCIAGASNLRSTPCYQPCNARACIEKIQGLAECTSYAEDAALCDKILQCPDEQ